MIQGSVVHGLGSGREPILGKKAFKIYARIPAALAAPHRRPARGDRVARSLELPRAPSGHASPSQRGPARPP